MPSDNQNRASQTTLPTEAEMDELLGKPGPAIEVDAASMAACVEASRQEARSQTTLQAALWRAIKNARDDAANDLMDAQRRLEELEELLDRMKAAGMDDHLPTLEQVQEAWRSA